MINRLSHPATRLFVSNLAAVWKSLLESLPAGPAS